jgi:hypothetical protein
MQHEKSRGTITKIAVKLETKKKALETQRIDSEAKIEKLIKEKDAAIEKLIKEKDDAMRTKKRKWHEKSEKSRSDENEKSRAAEHASEMRELMRSCQAGTPTKNDVDVRKILAELVSNQQSDPMQQLRPQSQQLHHHPSQQHGGWQQPHGGWQQPHGGWQHQQPPYDGAWQQQQQQQYQGGNQGLNQPSQNTSWDKVREQPTRSLKDWTQDEVAQKLDKQLCLGSFQASFASHGLHIGSTLVEVSTVEELAEFRIVDQANKAINNVQLRALVKAIKDWTKGK